MTKYVLALKAMKLNLALKMAATPQKQTSARHTIGIERLKSFGLILALTALCNPSTQILADESDSQPKLQAHQLATAPILDGLVDGDPGWQNIQPITQFIQHTPNHGASATMRTEVYLGYTEESLYVGFVCYEDDIHQMNVSPNGWESDSILMVLDTYQNEVSGYGFSSNQVGAEWDTSVFNSNTDWNWSTVWQVKSQVNDDNWSSEFVIPFTSLNYPNKEIQDWGINFSRYIRSRNEISHWAPIPRQFSIWRLGLAGTLQGIRPPPPKRNVKFTPYALSSNAEASHADGENREDWGFDVRYSLTPTLNLDATYNTDFAQVESDSLQINRGRFSLFFPETRPFFLENAQVFTVGVPRETLVFHSRAIGVARDGRRLPIDGGLKLTGSIGQSNQIGFIHMRADSEFMNTSEDFTVARYSREFEGRSRAGFIATNRKSLDWNSQTVGGDLQWGIGEFAEIRTFFASSQSNDDLDRQDEYTYAAYANYNTPKWQTSASFHEVGSGFDPAIGFAQRTNSRKHHVAVLRIQQLNGKWGLHEWQPLINYHEYNNLDGFKESSNLLVDSFFVWKNGANIWTAYKNIGEGLRYSFPLFGVDIPAGQYSSDLISVGGNLPQTGHWAVGGDIDAGEFYHGNGYASSIWVGYTPSEKVNLNLNYSANSYDFPNTTSPTKFQLSRLSFRFAFTPKLTFNTLLQHNSADDVISINARFAWLRRSNTGLYLVFNEFQDRSNMGSVNRQTLVIKYSHLFDINL